MGFIERISFPGWVIHPFILLGGVVLILGVAVGTLLWWGLT